MNWQTCLVGTVIGIIFVAIVIGYIRKQCTGKCDCESCGTCALHDKCHKNKP